MNNVAQTRTHAVSLSGALPMLLALNTCALFALEQLGGIASDQALHVGDMEELDVEGARRAGVHAALYAPGANGRLDTDAEFVVRNAGSRRTNARADSFGICPADTRTAGRPIDRQTGNQLR